MTKEFELGMSRLDALIYNLDMGWECTKESLVISLKDIRNLLES